MAAGASSTPPVAWGSVRIGREPLDDLEEVLRQCLFGQGCVVAPEHPANLLEERGVCHRICRYGVDAEAPIAAGDWPGHTAGRRLTRTQRTFPAHRCATRAQRRARCDRSLRK